MQTLETKTPISEKRKTRAWREINLEHRGSQGFIANAAIEDIRVGNEDWNGPIPATGSSPICVRIRSIVGWSSVIFLLLSSNWRVHHFKASLLLLLFFFIIIILFPASLMGSVAGSFPIIVPTKWDFHHLSLSLSLSLTHTQWFCFSLWILHTFCMQKWLSFRALIP